MSLCSKSLALGGSVSLVAERLRAGWSMEEATTIPPRRQPHSLKSKWEAAGTTISYPAAWQRIRAGWSEKEAFTTPPQRSICRERRHSVRDYVMKMKSVPCLDCGRLYPECGFTVMEFDHIPERGRKLFNIGAKVRKKVTLEEMIAEIAKCEVVCANCHRVRTAKRKLK